MNRIIVFRSSIQSDLSYVCGAYFTYFASVMSRNHTSNNIRNKFSRYTMRNVSIVSKFIYESTGTQIKRNSNFCLGFVLLTKRRKYYSCK